MYACICMYVSIYNMHILDQGIRVSILNLGIKQQSYLNIHWNNDYCLENHLRIVSKIYITEYLVQGISIIDA